MVKFEKKITQCRECPHCRIVPDPDPSDWFNDDDEKAFCREAGHKNGNSTIPFPYEFKYEKEYVWIKIEENWFKIILLRGWGHLTGVGGLHLPPDVAAKIQDEFGEWIAKTLNNKNDSI